MDENITTEDIAAMRRILGVNGASPTVVKGIATQYEASEGYVTMVAEAMRAEGTQIGGVIFENVGPGRPPSSLAGLERQRRARELVGQVTTAVTKGLPKASTGELAAVAATVGVIEATGPAPPKAIAESGAPETALTAVGTFNQRRAEELASRVNSAESKPLDRASTQELEAVAAARFG